jgi:RNA methyltransferase, TrmH family
MPPASKPTWSGNRERNELIITSRDNRWLKRFRTSLAGHRVDGDSVIGVEGVHLVEAALGSKLRVEAILVSGSGEHHLERWKRWMDPGIRVLRTTDRLFAGVADTQAPQGVAVLVHPRVSTLEDLLRGLALVVVLVGVQDPGNVGTILRAVEAFGGTGVATCAAGAAGTANPLAPKALRASAGSALRLPILRGASPTILLAQLRMSGVKCYAAVPDTRAPKQREDPGRPALLRPWEADWKSPVAMLIGNEGAGLPNEIVRSADARVSVPQTKPAAGGVESLNAAMAATVLLYETMRQRDDLG